MFVYIFVLTVTPVASVPPAGGPSLPIEQLLRSIAGTTEGRVRISTIRFYLLRFSLVFTFTFTLPWWKHFI